jgi:hypothetical protein
MHAQAHLGVVAQLGLHLPLEISLYGQCCSPSGTPAPVTRISPAASAILSRFSSSAAQ